MSINNNPNAIHTDSTDQQPFTSATVATEHGSSATVLNERQTVGNLELLEERVVVNKERLDVGKVIVTKEVRTKTVNVPIELAEEVLVISTEYYDSESQDLLTGAYDDKEVIRRMSPTLDSVTSININGKKVALGVEPVEIVLSRQIALVKQETHVVQEVAVKKSVHTHADTISVELKREELAVSEEGLLEHQTRQS